MPKIIAVGQHKNVGKDTFIKYCIDVLRPQTKSLRIVRRGFADKLYDFCHSVYSWCGFKDRQFYVDNPKMKEVPLLNHPQKQSPRDILIIVGNILRQYDKNIWINAALATNDADILFISDLRYPNEMSVCRELKAYTLRIVRPGLEIPTDEADIALNNYSFDEEFINGGSQHDLYNFAKYFVETRILK